MESKSLRGFTLLVASTLTVMAGAVIAPALPEISRNFLHIHQGELLSKLILTIPALVIAILSPVAGFFVDKAGRRKVLLFSLVLYAVAGTSGVYLSNIYHILVGRIFLGVAMGGLITAVITLIGDYYSGEQRSKFMGYQASFAGLGGLIFITAGGALADYSWRFPFLIYFSSLIVLVIAWISIKEPSVKSQVDPDLHNDISISVIPRGVYFVYLVGFFSMAMFYMIPVQMPFILSNMEGISNTQIGLAISFMNVSSVITSLYYSRVKKRLNFLWIMAVVYFAVFWGYFTISQSNTYIMTIIGIMICGLGFGLMMANINLWLVNLAPANMRGRLVGYLNSAIFLGLFLSPVLLQPLIALSSLRGSFLIVSVVILIISGVFALLGVRSKE